MNYESGTVRNVHYGDVLIKFGDYIDASETELPYISDDAKADKFKNSFLQDGDIIIADTAEDDTVGKCTEIQGSEGLKLLSGLHTIACRPKEKYGPMFMGYYINSPAYHNQLKPLMQGIKVTSISKSALQDTDMIIPKSIEEQTKIGEYLANLDNLITLHQRIGYVKSLIYETIAFSWEQRKFSDFTWNAGKRNSQNLDLEPYAVTNDRGFIRQNEAHDEFGYMKDVDRKTYNIVMPNSFAYNPARINVGSIGYYEGTENVIVSSLYEVFQTADYVDDRFLWHWFKSDIFPKWIERLQEGSVRLYFYYDKLCECKMLMPSLPEQKKIAATLDEIDNLITLHQRKYNRWRCFICKIQLKTIYFMTITHIGFVFIRRGRLGRSP